MTMKIVMAAALSAGLAMSMAAAQPAGHGTGGHGRAHPAGAASPYAGLEGRAIKALSDQQIADLEAGRGMGLALPAELHGYPGPMHVLELAVPLGLDPGQRSRTEDLVQSMKREAIDIGRRLIAAEKALDDLFASRRIDGASLTAATSGIGVLQADLRAAHLRYHLAMVDILAPGQPDTKRTTGGP